jgi:hypothetical protein
MSLAWNHGSQKIIDNTQELTKRLEDQKIHKTYFQARSNGRNPLKTQKLKKARLFGGGAGKSPRILFFVFLCFFFPRCVFLVFSGRFFLFFLVLLRVLFFPKGGRPYFQLSGGGGPVCVCFQSRECHQRNRTILHLFLFQGNLHKGTPHCPQGTQSSLKAQLLIEEYLFKITLDFFQGLLFLFK